MKIRLYGINGTLIRALALLLCAVLLSGLSGCAKKGGEASPTFTPVGTDAISYYDLDISGLVLAKYKGVEITKDIRVTDVDIAQAVYEDIRTIEGLNTYGSDGKIEKEHEIYSRYKELRITDRAAAHGDNVYISYTGYIDGEAFSGGNSAGTSLILGSDSYIPGFEDAVIGKMPGETFDIEISFPDPYLSNPELSGKPAVFTTKIEYIYPPLDDALAELLSLAYEEEYNLKHAKEEDAAPYTPEFTNAEEYRALKSEPIRKLKEEDFENNVATDLLKIIYDNSTFNSYPEALFKSLEATFDSAAAQYNVDRDTYLFYMYGIATEEQYKEFTEYQVGSDCIIAAIVRAENMSFTEAEERMIAEGYAKRYGLSSAEELYTLITRTELLNMMLSEKVLNFIVDAAVINIVE